MITHLIILIEDKNLQKTLLERFLFWYSSNMEKKYSIKNLTELQTWAEKFISELHPKENAQVITLSGDLGAGKTALVKACAKVLGLNEEITSPTFVIQKEYELERQVYKKMIHIDAYRLESAGELEHLGWNDIISAPENIIFLEWPEMVEGINLAGVKKIHLSINDNENRTLILED